LETRERLPDFLGPTQVYDGVLNRSLFQAEQGSKLLLGELFHADADVVGQDKFEKCRCFA
jgi:hypothetical protein